MLLGATREFLAALAAVAVVGTLAGCGGGSDSSSDEAQRQALEDYAAAVEPIRLGINDLLDRADPILSAYADGDLSAAAAQKRVGRLERREADYAVQIAELDPVPDSIRAAHDAYAHTFVLQDAYLSTLVAALPAREFDELPDFQADQRAAIIAWRTRLQVVADRLGATLPADLQQAGRGEISPSPSGD